MSFTNKVDYIPNQSFSQASQDESEYENKQLQKQKWGVLAGTFLVVVIFANIWIWSRPPIFESNAILLFSYPSQTELEFSQLAERKVETHRQRLKSNTILQATIERLQQEYGIDVNLQSLERILSAQASGRTITLYAKDENPDVLENVMSSWISVYLDVVNSEKQKNNHEQLESSNAQLAAIQQKIDAKNEVLKEYALANDITSLERDENRILNKIKALSANLDTAIAEKTAAQALLNSLNDSVKKGLPIIRDVDKSQINQTKQELQLLTSELSALEDKYTQAYLQRDPLIVKKQQTKVALEKSLADQLKTSEEYYLQDTIREVNAAKDKVKLTQEQFDEQNKKAQLFSNKLTTYKGLNDELVAIQLQAQTIRDQLISQEVQKPFDAKVSILEPPFTPNFPTGPDYWYQTLISVLLAIGLSVFSLLIFGLIVKQKRQNTPAANFVVMPGQSFDNSLQNLPHAQQAQKESTFQIGQSGASLESLRTLDEHESIALFDTSNLESKILVGLVFSGLDVEELAQLNQNDFSHGFTELTINGSGKRQIKLHETLANSLKQYCDNNSEAKQFWSHVEQIEDFDQLITNLAHDSELVNPEQINANVLRHTYIVYLVKLGVKLTDINQFVGRISPSSLAKYRQIQRVGQAIDIESIDPHYPLYG